MPQKPKYSAKVSSLQAPDEEMEKAFSRPPAREKAVVNMDEDIIIVEEDDGLESVVVVENELLTSQEGEVEAVVIEEDLSETSTPSVTESPVVPSPPVLKKKLEEQVESEKEKGIVVPRSPQVPKAPKAPKGSPSAKTPKLPAMPKMPKAPKIPRTPSMEVPSPVVPQAGKGPKLPTDSFKSGEFEAVTLDSLKEKEELDKTAPAVDSSAQVASEGEKSTKEVEAPPVAVKPPASPVVSSEPKEVAPSQTTVEEPATQKTVVEDSVASMVEPELASPVAVKPPSSPVISAEVQESSSPEAKIPEVASPAEKEVVTSTIESTPVVTLETEESESVEAPSETTSLEESAEEKSSDDTATKSSPPSPTQVAIEAARAKIKEEYPEFDTGEMFDGESFSEPSDEPDSSGFFGGGSHFWDNSEVDEEGEKKKNGGDSSVDVARWQAELKELQRFVGEYGALSFLGSRLEQLGAEASGLDKLLPFYRMAARTLGQELDSKSSMSGEHDKEVQRLKTEISHLKLQNTMLEAASMELASGEGGGTPATKKVNSGGSGSVSDEAYQKLEGELKAVKDQKDRLQSDYQSLKNRTTMDAEIALFQEKEKFFGSLLPVLDSFAQAFKSIPAGDSEGEQETGGVAEGMSMIYDQLMSSLKTSGLEEMKALGEPFDPRFHEAIGELVTEEYPDDHVAEEFQKGYLLGERLLRAALVRVARRD